MIRKVKIFKIIFLIVLFASIKGFSININCVDLPSFPKAPSPIETLVDAPKVAKIPKDGIIKQQFFMRDNFYDKGIVYSIKIFESKEPMHYKVWMQHKDAKLIFIIPGLGSHYSNKTLMHLAYLFYKAGYSVVAISNAFNWEFMQSASTTPFPGFVPRDAKDIYYALYRIYSHLKEKYKVTPKRIRGTILVGYSMGALYSLIISEFDNRYHLLNFERILAINPPIDLVYGMNVLDDFFNIISSWPKPVVDNSLKNIFSLFERFLEGKISSKGKLPLTVDEAKYIIGYTAHGTVVDMLASIHKRGLDGGAIPVEYKWYNQEAMYRIIEKYNLFRYITLMTVPYYSKLFNYRFTLREINYVISLRHIEESLRNNPKIRVVHNLNDFLLRKEDIFWLQKTFGDRIIFFTHGGHLGNLLDPIVKKYILQAVNSNVQGGFKAIEGGPIKKIVLSDINNKKS